MTNEPMSNMTNECASCLALLPEYHASAEYPLCVSCDRNCLADAYRAAEANMVALTADLRETRSALAAAQAECERLRAAGAWKPEEVWREEVADEVAEQIAKWLEQWEPPYSLRRDWGVQNPGEDLTVAHTLEMAAQQLRANAWKETR